LVGQSCAAAEVTAKAAAASVKPNFFNMANSPFVVAGLGPANQLLK
jgi:hypothetical protein